MRKKYENHYYPIVMVGGFFEEEYLEDFKEIVMKDFTKTPLITFVSDHIKKFDYSAYPEYIKSFTIMHNENFNENPGETNGAPGYFIGINLYSIPEQFSLKRIRIDVLGALKMTGLIDPEARFESVNLFTEVLKIKMEKD